MTISAIFPIGGFGTRFSTLNSKDVKPLISVGGKTQLEWAVLGAYRSIRPKHFVFGVRSALCSAVTSEIIMLSKKIDISYEIIDVGDFTLGSADTVNKAIIDSSLRESTQPFFSIDSDQATDFSMPKFQNVPDFFITYTRSNNPSHSFIQIDNENAITAIQEKSVISEYGVVGNYGFRCPKFFSEMFTRINLDKNNEIYISNVVSACLSAGLQGLGVPIRNTFSFGTPSEVENLDLRQLRNFIS